MSDIVARIQRDLKQDSYYGQNFANDGERFIAWYLRNVLLRSPPVPRSLPHVSPAERRNKDEILFDIPAIFHYSYGIIIILSNYSGLPLSTGAKKHAVTVMGAPLQPKQRVRSEGAAGYGYRHGEKGKSTLAPLALKRSGWPE